MVKRAANYAVSMVTCLASYVRLLEFIYNQQIDMFDGAFKALFEVIPIYTYNTRVK